MTYDNPYQYMQINVNMTMKPSYSEVARVFWNGALPALVGEYPRDSQYVEHEQTGQSDRSISITYLPPLAFTSGNDKVAIDCLTMMTMLMLTIILID